MRTAKAGPKQQDPAKERAILAAARALFAREGYRNSDVQDVADAAGVGKGTVYRYYGNKEELFRAVADADMQRLEAYVMNAIDLGRAPEDVVRSLGMAYAEFFQDQPDMVEIMIQERAEFRGTIPDTHLFYREKNRGTFEDVLRRGIDDGTFRQVNVKMATTALANVLYGTVVCGVLEGHSRSIRSTAKHAIDIFLQGLLK